MPPRLLTRARTTVLIVLLFNSVGCHNIPFQHPLGIAVSIGTSTPDLMTLYPAMEPRIDHLNVIITNRSLRDVRIWKEWCSWGYYNIEFILKDQSNHEYRIARVGRIWPVNLPDPMLIRSGDSFVRDCFILERSADSYDGRWGYDPLPLDEALTGVCTFTIEKDEYSKEQGVWTGTVRSEPFTIILSGAGGGLPEESYTSNRPHTVDG
jgi:hypothetical protein